MSQSDAHSFPLIEEWIDTVAQSLSFVQSVDSTRRGTNKANVNMATPPESSSSRTGGRRLTKRASSPTKRQRVEEPEHQGQDRVEGEYGWVEEPEEQTPRSSRHPLTIPFRGFGAMSNTLSQSSPSILSGNSSQTQSTRELERPNSVKSGRRTKSPVKSRNSLWALEVPVIHTPIRNDGANRLPDDVRGLYEGIEDATVDHLGIFPGEIRQDIEAIVPRASRRKDWFRDAQQESPPNQHKDHSADDQLGFPRSRKPISCLDHALHELDLLSDIATKAENCEIRTCAEATWNMQVHLPLLEHALSGHSTVHVEPALTAKILSAVAPGTGGRGGGNIIENKMIDFCLTLWLNDGNPRQLGFRNTAGECERDARLMSAISSRVWAQPPDMQSVNQTSYPPLQFTPIACNVETKTSSSSTSHASHLQLSVWTAAWYQRIRQLVPEGIACHGIVTLPLLHIIGHDWRLAFACWRGDAIEIVGDVMLGDTRGLVGMYTLVAVLRKLGDWIANEYRDWIENVFLEREDSHVSEQ